MRKLILAATLAAMPLGGCAGLLPLLTGVPASPAAVANKTTLDESAANAAHTAFDAWQLAVNIALDAGLHGAKAAVVLDYDKKVREAYDAARDAYHAANADNFRAAISDLREAVVAGSAIIKAK